MLVFAEKFWVQKNTAVSYDDTTVSGYESARIQTHTAVSIFDTAMSVCIFIGMQIDTAVSVFNTAVSVCLSKIQAHSCVSEMFRCTYSFFLKYMIFLFKC